MQKQQGAALAAFDHLEGCAGDRQRPDHSAIIAERSRKFQAALAERTSTR
jgi:hypothetical protein